MKNLKIVSWNIQGGTVLRSNERFDYSEENLKYFVDLLFNQNADIICLQEVHFSNDGSSSSKIAKALGGYKVFDFKLSPSHINSEFMLGNSILTKKALTKKERIIYPYPSYDLFFKNGKKAIRHDKGIQIGMGGDLYVANTHLFPLGIFGHTYIEKESESIVNEILDIYLQKLDTPLVFCGDFSGDFGDHFYEVMSPVFDKFGLKDALKGIHTRSIDLDNGSKTSKTDCVLYSRNFKLVNSGAIKTQTDHFLCYADLETL